MKRKTACQWSAKFARSRNTDGTRGAELTYSHSNFEQQEDYRAVTTKSYYLGLFNANTELFFPASRPPPGAHNAASYILYNYYYYVVAFEYASVYIVWQRSPGHNGNNNTAGIWIIGKLGQYANSTRHLRYNIAYTMCVHCVFVV